MMPLRWWVVLALAGAAWAQTYSANPGEAWAATDALGRVLPGPPEVGPPRPDRFVGIFYFLWHGQHGDQRQPPPVVAEILKKYPDALKSAASPPWGPADAMHYWGEPLFGFYLDSDPWVLRRHAALLSDAGVDTLIFDATNRQTYHDVYLSLCRVFEQIRKEGGRTPQIAFMVNTEAGATAQELYEDLYQRGLYSDLWFRWKGKPLMICDPEKASAEVRAFFTLRRAHWPFTQVNTPYAWHWEAAYPQHYGFTEDPKDPEQVNVSVAQNLNQKEGKVTEMSNPNARVRSFHNGSVDHSAGAVNWGYNAEEQWRRALELDPPFVMVTGWNEWIAGRFSDPGKGTKFIDQFSEEGSRDIEMMKGGHGDNYYYQMVANIRRYKGMPETRASFGPKSIDIAGPFSQWRDVYPEYRDHVGDTIARDFAGAGPLHYTDHSGRNDLELMKVAHDDRFVYFYVRTHEPITPPAGAHWMMLFIDTDRNAKTGWEGYDFVVNRVAPGAGSAVVEKNAGGWTWQRVGEAAYRVEGNQMQLAIPRELLGSVSLDFKWADNLQKPGDITDFYVSGDVAPEGRFNYRYPGGK